MSIQVNQFVWKPGENDAEYIRLLKRANDEAHSIMLRATGKLARMAKTHAKIVHGHWIDTEIPANTTGYGGVGQDKKKGILCSECRCAFDISLLWVNDYCPHCGAKMDGDSDG